MKNFSFPALLLILFVIFHYEGYSQPNFAVVSQDGQTTITNSIEDAIEQASDGDFIYLPPGNFSIDDLHISKEVHLIGVGHYPQATGATGGTILNGTLRFLTGADGSSVQGVRVNGSIICGTDETNCNVSDLIIKRCFARRIYLSYGWDKETTGSNFFITENVIVFAFYGGYGANTVFRKNILIQGTNQERPLTYLKDAIVENNIILCIDNVAGNLITGTTFRNNVIPVGNLEVINKYENNIYLNNLHTVETGLYQYGVVQNEGNVVIARENMFENQQGGAFLYEHDYHLTQDAIDAITGTDGTQVGIYGTNDPCKEYGIPPTPNIEYIKVSPSTQPDGKLKIEATVKAQQK